MISAARNPGAETGVDYEGWRVVAASAAAVFCTTVVFYSFAVLVRPLTEDFSWSRSAVSSAFGVMTLGAALSAPIVGQLFDRFGPKWISGPSLAIVGCAFASLSLLTPSRAHLYAVYIIIGVASAIRARAAGGRCARGDRRRWRERC
jgi:MFS family permease